MNEAERLYQLLLRLERWRSISYVVIALFAAATVVRETLMQRQIDQLEAQVQAQAKR
jgi:hypothetical protein